MREILDFCDGPLAGANVVALDAEVVEHPEAKVAEGRVVCGVVSHVALVLEASAGEDDRQVLAGVRGGVAKVARIEDGGVVDERGVAFAYLLHGADKATEEFELCFLHEGELLNL